MSNRELAQALRAALEEDNPSVPVKALIAAVLMCARGGAPTRLGMATVGGYSYGSSQKHYADLLDALVEQLPHVVAAMAADSGDPAAAARLRDDLQQRDRAIAGLRAQLTDLTERHEHVRRYALALHERLRALGEQGTLGEAEVLPFRPLSPAD